jgi:hypothetical protein
MKQKRQKKKKINKQTNSNGINMQTIENPFANLSEEEKRIVITEIQETNEKDYNSSLEEIKKLLKKYDPFLLLSILSNYYLMAGAGNKGVSEFNHENNINQADVEICQALLLQIKPENLKNKIPLGNTYEEIIEQLNKLSTSSHFKNMKAEYLDLSKQDASIKMIQEFVKSHTQTVRNWGNFNQVKIISNEIYNNFNELLLNNYGFTSEDTIKFFNYLIKETEKSSTLRFLNLKKLSKVKDIKKMITEYYKIIDNDEKSVDEVLKYMKNRTHEEVLLFIMSHYDLRLSEQYKFNIENIVNDLELKENIVASIVNQFSYNFEELKEYKTEYFLLDNPIWTKPLILINEKEFFCSLPQMFFSFILKSFDDIINKIDSKKLSVVKAKYLETKVEEIVKTRFHEINTIKSLKWKDNGKEYETDLITFIDCYAIIFEAKSGKIDNSSLRGAPKKLKRDIENLLIEPNIQSKRLKEKLEFLINNPKVEDKLRDKLPIELNKINKVLRVSISLEYFSSLQSNIKEIEDTGWIPDNFEPCPTMNIADFEVLFDIFEHPVQIINYLEQREEIEKNIKYKGDELDLIAVYIKNHFNFAGIDPTIPLIISGMSKQIDNYYQSKSIGIDIEKPKVKVNEFFERILIQLEDRKPDGWLQLGSILYRLLPSDQSKIINYISKIKKNISKNWMKKGHDNMIIYNPPLSSEYSFCFVIFNKYNKEERYNFFDEAILIALKPEHVKYCLAIAINIDMPELPYALIGFSKKENNKNELL